MKWASRLITNMQWSGPIANRGEKEEVANQIALKVKENDVIGIGSGSTCYLAIQAIGARIKEEGHQVHRDSHVRRSCSCLRFEPGYQQPHFCRSDRTGHLMVPMKWTLQEIYKRPRRCNVQGKDI